MKILPVGAELFHADGRPDLIKLIDAFAILRKRLNKSVYEITSPYVVACLYFKFFKS